MRIFLYWVLILTTAGFASLVNAHAEHDKARYVSPKGVDKGRCDNPKAPCQTIAYAAQHANKGDHIRLAEGHYEVKDTETLFYLMSDIIPIKPNYSQTDGFKKPGKKHLTHLIGVPKEYAEKLAARGYQIIVDRKGLRDPALEKQLAAYRQLQQGLPAQNCVNNMAGSHACNNLDLLAHVPLSAFSTNPAAANDIWGHYDMKDGREYALIGLRDGIGIVEVTDPQQPRVVTTISGQATIWRDIKVYQFYDWSSLQWKAYAYVTADNAAVGLMIIDLSDLPQSASLAAVDSTDLSAHNVYLSNVDYATGLVLRGATPYLHIAGSSNHGGAFNSYGLADPVSPSRIYRPGDATRSDYSHDVASAIITDERKDTQCINAANVGHCEIFADFNEGSFLLWDKTDNANPAELSETHYSNAAYVHSGWFTEDQGYVIVHDELDEQQFGLNTTVRFFDISDLSAPSLVGTYTGPTAAIDHNGFVRGNRYYMSNYERGMTVLDITDPASPEEVGFFDTFPFADSASFNGAWGVYPFLPSGIILVSDINSGLYILRDNTLTSSVGELQFAQAELNTSEGTSLTITVLRNGTNSATGSVKWEVLHGNSSDADMDQLGGQLNWLDGEPSKSIHLNIIDDAVGEVAESFFIRLYDPKNGMTLKSPAMLRVNIAASNGNNPPVANAGPDLNGEVGVEVVISGSGTDPDVGSLQYQWQQLSGPDLSLTNTTQPELRFVPQEVGNYVLELSVTDPDGNTDIDQMTLAVQPFNNPPQIDAGPDQTVETGQTVTLSAQASDPDGDTLSYQWVKLSGPDVDFGSGDGAEISFIASFAGTYQFSVTVTDARGKSASDQVTVQVNSVVVTTPAESGGSGTILWLLLFVPLVIKRRL